MKKFATIFLLIIASISILLPAKAADISDAFDKSSSSTLSQTVDKAGFYQDGNNIDNLTQTIINTILGFLGIIFTIIIIYAGIRWLTASGNPETISKAKGLLTNAVIGLIIVLAAYAISVAIFSFFIDTGTTLEY
jgi:type IV secretory pathway VirB2 component (pilin)